MKSQLLAALLRATALTAAPLAVMAPAIAEDSAPTPAEETARLNAWFEEQFQELLDRSPMTASYLGDKRGYGQWDDETDDNVVREFEISQAQLAEMREMFDPETLDPSGQLSFRLAEYESERDAQRFEWRRNSYVFHNFRGPHTQLASFLINIHQVSSLEDAEAYISRLEGAGDFLRQNMSRFEMNAEHGAMPPGWSFPIMIEASANVVKGAPFDDSGEDSTILADFRGKVAGLELDDEQSADLIARAEAALLSSVEPAYRDLIAMFERLQPTSPEGDGVWRLPDGDGFYAMRLNQMTTTDLSADEIHEIGLREMDRVHAEMRAIMAEVGFEGTLQEFFTYMREDEQFLYAADDEGRAAYLEAAETTINGMKERLPELFGVLPQADLVVKRVEAFREVSAGKAFYQRPAPDGSRPGTYYANLYDMTAMPTYQIEALAFHEGVPGHHMQIAIAQELEDVPAFRKFGGYTAYTEGWGLYSEEIPKELGFYADPYSDFGRLALELWRAARLVVDTGLHSKEWSREEATAYLVENTPNSPTDCAKAIDRYIAMPGQATAYMIGKLKIKELRTEAEETLGDDFDVRGFHDTVLENGAVPLAVLEELVADWVEETQAGQRRASDRGCARSHPRSYRLDLISGQ